jgi:hypothetical protein
MQFENNASPASVQGDCSLVSSEDENLIELSYTLRFHLRRIYRGGETRVHQINACKSCGRPIAHIRLIDDARLRILDAFECSGWPISSVSCWWVNIFDKDHQCDEVRP